MVIHVAGPLFTLQQWKTTARLLYSYLILGQVLTTGIIWVERLFIWPVIKENYPRYMHCLHEVLTSLPPRLMAKPLSTLQQTTATYCYFHPCLSVEPASCKPMASVEQLFTTQRAVVGRIISSRL
ncbi:hypothetical protein BDW59DRAFT_142132 [Aspergillus cavernicola]|uniref:Uncharacterized protein n=1 Tax=Aspergillus cavernicola TaxID=176166 RepID=A0ABR4INY0_9EURO